MKKLFFLLMIPLILFGTFCFASNAQPTISSIYNSANSYEMILNNLSSKSTLKNYENVLSNPGNFFFNTGGIMFILSEYDSFETPESVKIILNSVNVYQSANINSTILGKVYYGEVFSVLSEQDEFYEIAYETEVAGFILTAYALDTSFKSPQIFLDTNAIIINSSFVYKLIGDEFVKVDEIVLDINTRIKILDGYDINKTYCKTTFDYEGEIYTYYILTENINPDGISSRFVTAIMLIIVCVSIFLILYSFFKARIKR